MKTNPPSINRVSPERQPAILREMERMDAVINELKGCVNTLQERIACILSVSDPVPAPDKVPEKVHNCTFADSLHARISEVRNVVQQVESMIGSLEI